jgi:phosphoribosylformylglycinamidine synthase
MGSYNEYISLITPLANADRPFRMLYPDHFTRLRIAKALLSRLWSEGHFRLGDLRIWAQWEWNTRPIGNMAAFYESVRSAGEYIYGLGTYIEDYIFMESDHASNVKFFAWLPETAMTEDEPDEEREDILFKSSPYESTHPWITEIRKCPPTMQNDPDSWIIYIPFDTCRFKTGGSLLTQAHDDNGGAAPNIMDPDYFIDCYEVVRELTEDGILMAGRTVANGGLAYAASKMCADGGLEIDINGILSSYQEEDRIKVLFGEIPGVLIQISDENYDYVDSQFLLQDIAYYPVGRPTGTASGLSFTHTGKTGVADILASLLRQASEGED